MEAKQKEQIQTEFWKIGNTIFWSLNSVILLTIILDILILSKDWLDFVMLKIVLLVLFYFVYKIFKNKYGTPNLLIHTILFSFNFLALISISYTNTGNRLIYTTLIIALFVGYNILAIWSILNSFLQYLLVILIFYGLYYAGIITNPIQILKEGGYVFLSLGFVSLFFPKIKQSVIVERVRVQMAADDKINFLTAELSETNYNHKTLKNKVVKKENEYKFLFQQISNDLNKIESTLQSIQIDNSQKEKVEDLSSLLQNLRNQSSIYFKPINLNAPKKQNFMKDAVEVKKVYLDVIKGFKNQVSAKNLQFLEIIKDNSYVIAGNQRMFNTIVYNMINFVVIYSNDHDKIEIRLEEDAEDKITFTVINKDYGLSNSEIESYFRDMEYVNYDYKKHGDSVKIGLRISKQLTEKMNGYFSYVSSENMGYQLKIHFNKYKLN